MAAKQDPKAYSLIDLYVMLYTTRFSKRPLVNKYRDRWGFSDMIDSIGYDESVKVLKYYMTLDRPDFSLQYLFNNFDKLVKQIEERDADRARREKIRQQTKQRTEG